MELVILFMLVGFYVCVYVVIKKEKRQNGINTSAF